MKQGMRLKTKYILWRNILSRPGGTSVGIEFYGGSQRGWVKFADQAYQYSPSQAKKAQKSYHRPVRTRSEVFLQKVVSVVEIDEQNSSPEIQKHMKMHSRRFK